MNIRKIKFGIILVYTESLIKIDIKDTIILLYIPSINDEYLSILLDIIIKFIDSIPSLNDINFICINNEIHNIISNYNDILTKIENIKNLFNIIINDLYSNNLKLKDVIYDSLFIKSKNINDVDTLLCDDVIKKIIKSLSYYNDLSVNSEKILLKFNNNINFLFNLKKKKECNLLISGFSYSNFKFIQCNILSLMNDLNININNHEINIIFNYNTHKIDSLITLFNIIIKNPEDFNIN